MAFGDINYRNQFGGTRCLFGPPAVASRLEL